jgi:hypothetical protein
MLFGEAPDAGTKKPEHRRCDDALAFTVYWWLRKESGAFNLYRMQV